MKAVGTRLIQLGIATAAVGATIGMLMGVAFGATINCSHVYEFCQGTGGNDEIGGWENANEIIARDGRDYVWGYGTQDYIWGQNDGDALFAGEGGDNVYGGYGNDSTAVTQGGGVYGNSEADYMEGNSGDDTMEGGTGQDNIHGGDHNDWLGAEDGQPDIVQGGAHSGFQPCWVDGYDAYYACTHVY
jgi:Ca2+-binding RTX toxin-like protein